MADKYVRSSGGNNANDGLSFANGWETLQYAFDNTLAGDRLIICGNFTISAVVDIDMNAGANASAPSAVNNIYIQGADSSGNIYNGTGKTTITTTTNALTSLFTFSGAADYFCFQDITWDGGGSGKATRCVYNVVDGCSSNNFLRCRFTNASSHGAELRNGFGFTQCELDNNGKGGSGSGYASSGVNRGPPFCYFCSFHHNATHGVHNFGAGGRLQNCISYRNGGSGFFTNNSTTSAQAEMINCTSCFNTGDGVNIQSLPASIAPLMCNITCSDNGGYGFNFSGRDINNTAYLLNCHTHNNSSGVTDINGGVLPGSGHRTGNPLYVSTISNSENFNFSTSSPLSRHGMSVMVPTGSTGSLDIGAIQCSLQTNSVF